ncbi:hypothetical protein NEOLEDRAFT_188397 [Neolentinus lepideus HHB14362 ss-1]|uniref:DNA replication checkpoint mediator MRC1 domain-containing protein n=1 Tax=Neolentinus lepideus HHB14362 ss-1 TaxID=1314782 RepID=A0A165TQT7_9AGAM|nr:hypothetical protein NEOLEDRAFT_188397 [Neolentinus lepideus HHB14362 ss-1]
MKRRQQSPEKPIPPSDPIQEYSSPGRKSLQAESSIREPLSQGDEHFSFGSPFGLGARSPIRTPPATQSSPLKFKRTADTRTTVLDMDIPPPADSDSDDSLRDFGEVMREDDKKREQERKQQELLERKMSYIEQQRQMKAQAQEDDSDDDLVVVPEEKLLRSPSGLRKRAPDMRFPGVPAKKKESAAMAAAARKMHNRELLQKYEVERKEEVKKKEEDYVRRGGQLKETARAGEKRHFGDVVEESIKRLNEEQRQRQDEDEDGSDEEWRPEADGNGDNNRGVGVQVDNEFEVYVDNITREDEGQENMFIVARDENPTDEHTVQTDKEGDNSGSENEEVPRHRRRAGRLPGTLQESDDDYEENIPSYSLDSGLEADTSFASVALSLASSSDEEDKENDPKKIWDGDEDKENKALPRASLFARLFASQGTEPLYFNDDEDSGSKPARAPFAVLSEGDDEAFFAAGSGVLGSPIAFGKETDSFSRSVSPQGLQFQGRDCGFSQFSDNEESGHDAENDENTESSGLKQVPLVSVFSEFFEPTLPKSKMPSEKALGKRPAREEPIEVWQDDSDEVSPYLSFPFWESPEVSVRTSTRAAFLPSCGANQLARCP